MAILALPLVISVLKPHASHFFLLRPARANFLRLRQPLAGCTRQFSRTRISAISETSAAVQYSSTEDSKKSSTLTFQQAIQRLQEYWASVGCAIMQCSNTEVGAGTMNPLTYLRVLGPEPWNVAYVEPSIRPDDSRYGENPNRLQRHTQFQVILKPDPGNSQDLFIRSLAALGIDVSAHDIRFVEDNWESPVLGAWGLGWEIWMDGMEITQFTYFQQAGSLPVMPVSVEITYGLERILMLLQGVDHFKKIRYADGITYGELFLENEKEMSAYYLEHASVHHVQKNFDLYEEEARSLLALGLPIPAYDQLLKTSHAFNILDSRGFIGVTERARYFGRMRSLARQCAQLWLKTRESLGYPLGIVSEPVQDASPKDALVEATKRVSDEPRLFVLEVGTEEMPPHDVVNASQQLKDLMLQLLETKRFSHGEVQAFGTPRRLVILMEDLGAKQMANEVEVRGPPVSKAYDSEGNPTKAAEGFCRRYSVDIASIYKKADGKTEYIYACVKESARLAVEVLSEDLAATVAKISFPKSMRWNSQIMFSRPIRWILALHGDAVVPFTFAGLSSGNLSYGLRNTPSATVTVGSAESYVDLMRNAGIQIDIEDRKKKILDSSQALAASVDGHIVVKEALLNEVVNLVEAPVPILGKFKDSFLELPEDLLTMVMQKHQKYFALTDNNGALLPYFIAVANGAIDESVVRHGNEAVLRARYEDAKFFYEMDTRKNLSEFREQLKGILFHEKLGTMLDKMVRLEKTVAKQGQCLGVTEDQLKLVQEAASLAMSDLATAVVTEFTSLAGIMGRHYALRDGYQEQVAEALFEITLPRFSGDKLPKSDVGIVLAIADRFDSLIGLFAAGCQPSSTNDPFGLRRISYGLVQLLVEKDKHLNLKEALQIAAAVQPIDVDEATLRDAYQFIIRRLEQYLVDRGTSPEIVRSVLAERATVPSLAAKSAFKMEKLSRGELFQKVVEAYSRPTRIVRGKDVDPNIESGVERFSNDNGARFTCADVVSFLGDSPDKMMSMYERSNLTVGFVGIDLSKVDEAAFQTNEERELWTAFLTLKDQIKPDIDVETFFELSAQLVQPLENFFNNVFVMVEDAKIRNNRLALLRRVADLPRGIADLSLLPGF